MEAVFTPAWNHTTKKDSLKFFKKSPFYLTKIRIRHQLSSPDYHPPSFRQGLRSKVTKCHVWMEAVFTPAWNHTTKKDSLKFFKKSFFAKIRIWQLAIFPGGHPPSSFAASSLYDRVRDGNGWDPAALSPENRFWLAYDEKHHQSNRSSDRTLKAT